MASKKKQATPVEPDEPKLRISGDALYAARQKLGVTQLEICRRARGLTPRLLSTLEGDTGPNVTLEVLGRIAHGYGVADFWKLCTYEPRPKLRKSRR